MEINSAEYTQLIDKIKERIRQSQYAAMQSVNKELINLYWAIGRAIVEKQDQFGWGKSVVRQLSSDLLQTYPESKGYLASN